MPVIKVNCSGERDFKEINIEYIVDSNFEDIWVSFKPVCEFVDCDYEIESTFIMKGVETKKNGDNTSILLRLRDLIDWLRSPIYHEITLTSKRIYLVEVFVFMLQSLAKEKKVMRS